MGGTQDFGNNSVSTDLMYKLYDDEKKNSSEYIKNSLIAKFETINRTVKGIQLSDMIEKIENWKMIDDFVSEHNSPLMPVSVRRSSKLDSEMAPFFGLASTHSISNHSNQKPFINNSFKISCPSQTQSKEELKVDKESMKLSHRKSVNLQNRESNHNLVHEDSMMNIGVSKFEYDKKTSPIIGAPSIEDIEEEKEDNPHFDDEEVIRISRFKNNFTNSEDCDESAIEDSKSHDHLTSKDSFSHLIRSISFNELGQSQEPAVIGLKLGGLNSVTLSNNLAYNEPGFTVKRRPVSEFCSHSSRKFLGKINNFSNTLEDDQKTPKSLKKMTLSENKTFDEKGLHNQNSVESLILAVTARNNLSEKGFGSFMDSDNCEEDHDKSVFSHDLTHKMKFKLKDPIIEGGGKFLKQKSMDLQYPEKRRAYSTFLDNK